MDFCDSVLAKKQIQQRVVFVFVFLVLKENFFHFACKVSRIRKIRRVEVLIKKVYIFVFFMVV